VRKRILFVDDDAAILDGLRQGLEAQNKEWDMVFVGSGSAALERMADQPFDVIVADLHMPGMSGAQLLNEAGKRFPKTVRFILANSADKELIMKCVLGTHQFLAKPCRADTLIAAIRRGLILDSWLGSESLKALVARIRTFPSIPSRYYEVLKELNSPDASAQRVGEVIAKDLAMMTKLLQMINSAFFALPRQITDPTEAVSILGFESVKSLVLCIQVFSQFDKVKPTYFSIDRLWRHSTAVAHAARNIALAERADQEMVNEAYMAGLLHDIGKLVLVSHFGEQYSGAQNLARKNQMPLWEVERELFGASHAEIGAYLTALWGLPLPVAEAAALHHAPLRSEEQSFTALTTVHAANVLINEEGPDPDGFVAPALDAAYLEKLGLAGRIPTWRDIAAGKPVTPGSSQSETPLPEPTTTEQVLEPVISSESKRNSLLIPALVGLAGVILIWFLWPRSPSTPVSWPSDHKTNLTAVQPPQIPSISPPEEPSVPAHSPINDSPGIPEDAPSTAEPRAETAETPPQPAAVPSKAPPEQTQEPVELRLQSIIYHPSSPSVMINGQQLTNGQQIEGFTIISISPQNVILQSGSQRKVLAIKEPSLR